MPTVDPKTLYPASDFFSTLQSEGLRLVHQYQVRFQIAEIEATIANKLNYLTMFAQGLDLPSRTQNYAEVYYLGYPFQQATNMTWSNEITMTLNCDAFNELRNAMLFWQGIITNPAILGGAKGDGLKTATQSQMIIDLYDQTMNTVVETYTLYGVAPANVGEMSLSNNGDAVATFPASFKYQFFSTVPA